MQGSLSFSNPCTWGTIIVKADGLYDSQTWIIYQSINFILLKKKKRVWGWGCLSPAGTEQVCKFCIHQQTKQKNILCLLAVLTMVKVVYVTFLLQQTFYPPSYMWKKKKWYMVLEMINWLFKCLEQIKLHINGKENQPTNNR